MHCPMNSVISMRFFSYIFLEACVVCDCTWCLELLIAFWSWRGLCHSYQITPLTARVVCRCIINRGFFYCKLDCGCQKLSCAMAVRALLIDVTVFIQSVVALFTRVPFLQFGYHSPHSPQSSAYWLSMLSQLRACKISKQTLLCIFKNQNQSKI